MLYLLSLLYLIPIIFKILTVYYLSEVKNYSNCEKINSPYLSFYYYYEWIELIILFILMILTFIILYYFTKNVKKSKSLTKSKRSKKSKKGSRLVIKNSSDILYHITSIILLIFYVKLLYDISQEEECKHVEPGLRNFLFVINVISLVVMFINLFV